MPTTYLILEPAGVTERSRINSNSIHKIAGFAWRTLPVNTHTFNGLLVHKNDSETTNHHNPSSSDPIQNEIESERRINPAIPKKLFPVFP